METLETQVRDIINRQVARGRVTVRVTLHSAEGKLSARMHLKVPLAKAYASELAKLAKQLKLSDPITLDQIVRAPGVYQTDEELTDAEDLWPAVEKSLNEALAGLVKMREREGGHLAKDLSARIGIMKKCAERVQKQAPVTAENYRRQLIERVKSAGLESISVEDERLLKEIVLFADRSDISEELTRLFNSRIAAKPRSPWVARSIFSRRK
jgi:uncharacterized protein (TIGR00255 family)